MGIELQIENHISEVLAKIQTNLKNKMVDATNEVRNQTMESLSGDRHGKQYNVPGTKTKYTASAPGEAPAVATARMRQSIKTEVSDDGLRGGVGSDLDYPAGLEMGTSKTKPRPWLKPSFEAKKDDIQKIFTSDYEE